MLIMGIESIESSGPRSEEIGLPSLDQEKAMALEESDEDRLIGELTRFIENCDQSIPRIATLMGVSDAVLSMWIARTTKPTPIKISRDQKILGKFLPGPLR
jgi:hypothetical protein